MGRGGKTARERKATEVEEVNNVLNLTPQTPCPCYCKASKDGKGGGRGEESNGRTLEWKWSQAAKKRGVFLFFLFSSA